MQPFTVRYHSHLTNTVLKIKPMTAFNCRHYFSREWPKYQIEMFDETGDGNEIFIVLGNNREHVRFHAKRE